MKQSRIKKESVLIKIPPPPKKPEPYECCGRGCDPCIHDYYAKALARWERRVTKLEKLQSDSK